MTKDFETAEEYIQYWFEYAGIDAPDVLSSDKFGDTTKYRVAIEKLAFTFSETVKAYKTALADMAELKVALLDVDRNAKYPDKDWPEPNHEFDLKKRFHNAPSFLKNLD